MAYLTSAAELLLAVLCLLLARSYWKELGGELFWRAMSAMMVIVAVGLVAAAANILEIP